MFEPMELTNDAVIKVIGVGGGGGNAVEHMVRERIENILICGGSGAGKTFYEVKPNLMQMPHNCSFICTDPKGE